jgi:hypothetical protein
MLVEVLEELVVELLEEELELNEVVLEEEVDESVVELLEEELELNEVVLEEEVDESVAELVAEALVLDSLVADRLVPEEVPALEDTEPEETEAEVPELLALGDALTVDLLVVPDKLTPEELPVPDGRLVPDQVSVKDPGWDELLVLEEGPVKVVDKDPDAVASEHGGGGFGDGHVVSVLLTTTVTTLGGLVRVRASEPWWLASTPAAMPRTRAEMARSDWSERRCILNGCC